MSSERDRIGQVGSANLINTMQLVEDSSHISDRNISLRFIDKSENDIRVQWDMKTGLLTAFAFIPRGIEELKVPFNETDFQALSQGAQVTKAEPKVIVEWEGPYYPASMEDARPLFRKVPGIGECLYTAIYDAATRQVTIVKTRKSEAEDVFDIPLVIDKPKLLDNLLPEPIHNDPLHASPQHDTWRNVNVLEATGIKWHR